MLELLPAGLPFDPLWVYLSVFGVSWFSGVFGMGGGIILLALMTLFVPQGVLVPLHGLLVMTSLGTRALINHKYIKWKIVGRTGAGAIIGAGVGVTLAVAMRPDIFFICLGLLMLYVVWHKGEPRWRIPFFWAGIVHGAISATFGTGGVLQAVFAKVKMNRHKLVATFAAFMLVNALAKTLFFSAYGFDVASYMPLVLLSFIPAILGSIIGKACLHKLPEDKFRWMYRALVTLLAIRLLVVGIYGIVQSI